MANIDQFEAGRMDLAHDSHLQTPSGIVCIFICAHRFAGPGVNLPTSPLRPHHAAPLTLLRFHLMLPLPSHDPKPPCHAVARVTSVADAVVQSKRPQPSRSGCPAAEGRTGAAAAASGAAERRGPPRPAPSAAVAPQRHVGCGWGRCHQHRHHVVEAGLAAAHQSAAGVAG